MLTNPSHCLNKTFRSFVASQKPAAPFTFNIADRLYHCASPAKRQWSSNSASAMKESGDHVECNHLMDISEVALYLNMKPSTIYSHVEHKQIPHIRIGKLIRFNREQIDDWLAMLTVPTDPNRSKEDYRGFHKSEREIDNIVERAIAGSSRSRYTAKQGKQPASSGREV